MSGCQPAAGTSSGPEGAVTATAPADARNLARTASTATTETAKLSLAAASLTARILTLRELGSLCQAAGAGSAKELQPRIEDELRSKCGLPHPGAWLAALEQAVRENRRDCWGYAYQSLRDLGVPRPDVARAEELQALLDSVPPEQTHGSAPAPVADATEALA